MKDQLSIKITLDTDVKERIRKVYKAHQVVITARVLALMIADVEKMEKKR